MHRSFISALIVCGLTAVAAADTITLKNGNQVHGKVIKVDKRQVKVKAAGGVLSFPRDQVIKIVRNQKDTKAPKVSRPAPKRTSDAPRGDDPATDAPKTQDAPTKGGGRSVKDRLAAVGESSMSAEEQKDFNVLVGKMGRTGRQGGNPAQIRRNARDAIIKNFGIRALPRLDKEVRGGNYWKARMSAGAIYKIASGPDAADAKWLLCYYDTPSALIKLLTHAGQPGLSPFMREAVNQALEALSGHSVGFKHTDEENPSAQETAGQKKWQAWWKKRRAEWKKENGL